MKVAQFYYQEKKGWKGIDEATELDSASSLVLVFFSPTFSSNSEIFKDLKSKFKNSQIVGCSTSGEIAQDHIRDDSLTCSILKLESGNLKTYLSDVDVSKGSFSSGEALAKDFELDDLKGIFVLSEGLNVNGSELVKGINSIIDSKKVVVSGGLAGDGGDFNQTYILLSDNVLSNKIIAVGFYGEEVSIRHGSKGGWDIFGPKRVMTKSEGNILYEIDGRPALELYKKYLGEKAKDLPGSALHFPIRITFDDSDKEYVRTILAVDEEKQSLIFAGDIPQGSTGQLMKANFDNIVDGSSQAGELVFEDNGEDKDESVSIAVSCVGRRLVLGARADDEIEALNDAVNSSPVIGFYSYGEISPIKDGKPCELHNQTMTVMRITEKKAA